VGEVSLQAWLEILHHLQPTLGPFRLPLIEEQLNAWVHEPLRLPDGDTRKQPGSTKDLSLFARHPWLNVLSVEAPFQSTIVPGMRNLEETTVNATALIEQQRLLIVYWNCPVCGSSLTLMKQ
jgi:hypothetical protein